MSKWDCECEGQPAFPFQGTRLSTTRSSLQRFRPVVQKLAGLPHECCVIPGDYDGSKGDVDGDVCHGRVSDLRFSFISFHSPGKVEEKC